MIETLLGHIKGVLGKSFVLAGLLPSAIFLFAWDWYAAGGLALPRIVRGLVAEPSTAAEEAVFTALLLLTGGLVFFACRGPVLRLYQSIDWKSLAPLRALALRRQWSKWNRLRREIEERYLKLDAFLWARRDFGPWRARSPVRMPTVPEAVLASERARQIVNSLLGPYARSGPTLLSEQHERAIIDGLCQLYVVATVVYDGASPPDSPPDGASPPDSPPGGVASPPDDTVEKEIGEWERLLAQPLARAVVGRAKAALPSRWARALSEFRSSYPQDEQWLRPTALGNRMAALDDYAERRYQIDTSTLWTRLAGILSKESRDEIADAQLSVEVLTNLSVGALVFGALVLSHALYATYVTLSAQCRIGWSAAASCLPHIDCLPPVFFNLRAALVVGLSAFLSFVFYRGAVYAFGTVAEKMVKMIDLQRLQLIAALGYKFPQTVGEELEIFDELQRFFAQGNPRDSLRPLAQPPKGGGEAKKDAGDSPPDEA